ncbi:hypothetical protein GGF31_003279 [Allomyces arbusculus]|nr:hypothetical protein GGF31_003279 [Allomyces arbusculus]
MAPELAQVNESMLANGAAYAAILVVPHITANYAAALAVLVAAETLMGVMVAGTICILWAWYPEGAAAPAAFSVFRVVFCAGICAGFIWRSRGEKR